MAAPTPTHEFAAVVPSAPAVGAARKTEAQPELEDGYLVALAVLATGSTAGASAGVTAVAAAVTVPATLVALRRFG